MKPFKIRVYIDKETSYVHIQQKDGNETEFLNITIKNKVTHDSVIGAFVEMCNSNQITGSWNNLSDEEKMSIRDEFDRLVGERYAPDNIDRNSMFYDCTISDEKWIAVTRMK